MNLWIGIVFAIGYLAIIFESKIRVNKTASALLMAVVCWMFDFFQKQAHLAEEIGLLGSHLNDVSQIIFFLLGAMALVELIDSHQGFRIVTDLIQTNSKRKLLWILGFATFFLSAVLDNLTTTIVVVSLLRKLVPDHKDRLLLGSMAVIAANAGGAWTPIGDVTTTMLWIQGNITTLAVMRSLFVPSIVCLVASLICLSFQMSGTISHLTQKAHEAQTAPGGRIVFFCGIGGLIFVPIFKALTGMPPFMGMLIALGALWLITDLMHHDHEDRQHLRVPHILTRIDTSGVLFFLGILLCIGALESAGMLESLAHMLNEKVSNLSAIAVIVGIVSAVVDNVPLVAAGMGMYPLSMIPTDAPFWLLLAYCAGTGGSMLIIGSAAGVAFMGMEKVDFLWYLHKIAWIAAVGYFAGVGAYFLI